MVQKESGQAPGRAPEVDQPGAIRNVVLVGHTGAGKTTLVEALLAATGTIPRAGRVEDGTTVCDFDEAEQRQHRSVGLSLAPLVHAGTKVNLLDTPGYADFVGDLRAGLRAADAALFVVSAVDEVDGTTRMLWEECAAVAMPRAVVVTKLDKERADFAEAVRRCQEVFGDGVQAAYVPDSDRLVPLLSGEPLPDVHEPLRAALLEGVIAESEDETLMDRYLGGEPLDHDLLVKDLETAVARARFHPVLPVSPLHGSGLAELLDLVVQGFPSPLEHEVPPVTRPDGSSAVPMSCDPSGPLLAEVVKTTSDPYVGRLSLVRVFSGTLKPESVVHVSGHFSEPAFGHEDHDLDERVGSLSSPLGKQQRPVAACCAGDICAVAKLTRAETGDTLSDKDEPLLMRPWTVPEALMPVAVHAKSKADEDKLSQGLARLVAEDPTLRLVHDADTGQLVLWCMGEAHTEVLLSRLRDRYGVAVEPEPVRVPLRETFAGPAKGQGRHVKQSGGHGQYAVCLVEVEPLPTGSGFEFVDKVVGGAVPRQFIPSVEKGVRAQMARGVAAGYPVVDLRVTLVDGKAHSVDSSDMAFQTAGALALREAAKATQVHMLEPVDEITVLVPDEHVGAVMSDLAGRRGRVLGTEPVGVGRTLVRAEVPQLGLVRYVVDLRSMSHGTATFTRSYRRHEPMPPRVALELQQGAAVG